MAKLITIYWRDIPSQIIAKKGRKSSKIMLSDRFQVAIDRAAMRAGAGTSDAYMADWERKETNCDDDIESVAAATAAKVEAEFDDELLDALTKAQGLRSGLNS